MSIETKGIRVSKTRTILSIPGTGISYQRK